MKKLPILIACGLMASTLGACANKSVEIKGNAHPFAGEREAQLDFEKTYVTTNNVYAEGGKFALSVLSNIAGVVAGSYFKSPTATVSGVVGLVNTLSDRFFGTNGPTMADVMSKLNEMDTKLDGINQKLDENFNQLSTESARTQAKVDQGLLEDMEKAISDFNTNYAVKLENYERNFADYLDQSYKAYVSQEENAHIAIYKENNEWVLNSVSEKVTDKMTVIDIKINDFTNSTTFLEKHYNIVEKGFIDRLEEDMDRAINGVRLPNGLDAVTCRQFVEANLIENMTKDYYVANHDKALELRNLAINYAEQIAGKGVKSIADRYFGRLKFMYNFASEIKDVATDLYANLKHNLITHAALAAQACLYAEVNQDEIKTNLEDAENVIKKYNDLIQDLPETYCFVTENTLKGNFYCAHYDVGYENYGNHPTFHANLTLDRVHKDYCYYDNFADHKNILDSVNVARLAMRFNLMRQLGATEQTEFVRYLADAKVVDKDGIEAYDYMIENKYITTDGYRILTGLTTRALNDGDKNLEIQCMEKGNKNGDYFHIGWKGNYKGAYEGNCWSGQIAETTFMDGVTGLPRAEKKVCAFANYDESHWNWFNDEHACFVDNAYGNYFFMIDVVA